MPQSSAEPKQSAEEKPVEKQLSDLNFGEEDGQENQTHQQTLLPTQAHDSPQDDDKEQALKLCEICADSKQSHQILAVGACTHAAYCTDCISRHVAAKIGQSGAAATVITCPASGCGTAIELDSCRGALPKAVIDKWEEALCRNSIGESQRFYCPFRDCSAMLVAEPAEAEAESIRESECPYCHRLFCAQCGVAWHSGVDCEVFQGLGQDERGREDIMVMEMAESNKWGCCVPLRKFS
ncbi:unnamed protein product [Linum tenue]|uniref:RBR-type E3 ubiquitin transferase n=1 Tax=Linum tenue TaxID=586396 RepID=A0AAV0PSL2_9ROSI|nr:unnamed protein product [Linum tenue]